MDKQKICLCRKVWACSMELISEKYGQLLEGKLIGQRLATANQIGVIFVEIAAAVVEKLKIAIAVEAEMAYK